MPRRKSDEQPAPRAPKRGKHVAPSPDAVSGAVLPEDTATPNPNLEYLGHVQEDINTIMALWPDISSEDPLSLDNLGYLAPYTASSYDTAAAGAATMGYTCGVNFFWLNSLRSLTPWIPLYRTRTIELAAEIFPSPGLMPTPISVVATFTRGEDIPKGDLLRLSPDEISHAVLHRVASRIQADASKEELAAWKRMLLSCPCTFRRIDNQEDQLTEAARLRQSVLSTAKGVAHSARQLVYNVQGLKNFKEKASGNVKFSAADIAKFWAQKVTTAPGTLNSKSMVDACLTIYDRLFSIAGIEQLVAESEAHNVTDSPWNSVWRLQEVIYRCRAPAKISWTMHALNDMVLSGRIRLLGWAACCCCCGCCLHHHVSPCPAVIAVSACHPLPGTVSDSLCLLETATARKSMCLQRLLPYPSHAMCNRA